MGTHRDTLRHLDGAWPAALAALGLALALAATAASCASPPPDDDDDTPGTDRPDGGGGGGGGPKADAAVPAGGGCKGDGSAQQPFGAHTQGYAPGSIRPSKHSQAELDDAVRLAYSLWKSRHLERSCGGGRTFVRTGEGARTVSEAQGYGMIITAYMAGYDAEARAIFDGLWAFVKAHPSKGSPALVAWEQPDGCGASAAANSATDGDLDVAYALLLADRQWGSSGAVKYRAEAKKMIDGIRWAEMDASTSYVRLGDWTSPGDPQRYNATRSSDFMPGHFASFEVVVGDGVWSHVVDRSYQMIASLQAQHAASTGLVPDFVVNPASGPAPAPPGFLERPVDGAYAFNACRVPWRLAVHFLTGGDARARAAVQKMNVWIRGATGSNPGQIKSGYSLGGAMLDGADFRSAAFVAPFGVGAMVDASNQAWLDAIWDQLAGNTASEGYYADSLELLSMIVMSGNWWAPELAPCAE